MLIGQVIPIDVALEDRTKVAALTHQLAPLAKKVLEILPLFLAMTNQVDVVKKFLTSVSGKPCVADLRFLG